MATKERKARYYLGALTAVFVVVFLASFTIGKYPVSPVELLHVLIGKLFGSVQDWTNEVELVLFKIRLPRVLAGTLIGAGLAAAGAAYQGLFRNPLVSPDVLGASAGAGFGAALSLFLSLGYALVTANAFICGVAAVGIAYLISTRARQNPTLGMVLAGIMIGSLFSAGISFIKLVADPNNVLPTITYWLMGSVAGVTTQKLLWASGPILCGLVVLLALRWKLNLLAMGEDEARSMGVSTRALRTIIVIAATIITAACVSISGLIGWVGLVIPHFARMLVGHDYRIVIPASMLFGASFLLLVDCVARSLVTAEIPIGILTAFIGAPFFLYLILDKGNRI
ncbi:MAG: iron ABC transporter permease [Coriobacteriia bacterium]|nr:iron ABC transporter permease [Coriobacteriia bacterium]